MGWKHGFKKSDEIKLNSWVFSFSIIKIDPVDSNIEINFEFDWNFLSWILTTAKTLGDQCLNFSINGD